MGLKNICHAPVCFRVLLFLAASSPAATTAVQAQDTCDVDICTSVGWSLSDTGTSTSWSSLPTARTITFTTITDHSVLLLASISRVQQSPASNTNTVLRLLVDGTNEVAISNTGNHMGFAYRAIDFHGVPTGLSAGTHTAEIQYKGPGGNVLFLHDANGLSHVRLTAVPLPSTQISSAFFFLTNCGFSGCTNSGTSTEWAALPTPLTTSFTTVGVQSVLLLADLSRVQNTVSNANTRFRILVDGSQEVALSNTGDASVWQFDAVHIHGVAASLAAGAHVAEVQYKTSSGSVYMPMSDNTGGFGYARLTAVSEPSSLLTTTFSFPTAPSPPMTSTAWAALPSPLTVTFTTSGLSASAVLLADVARLQHWTAANVNTELRILVDGAQEVAYTNSGTAYGFAFRALSFHGVATSLTAGTHTAQLQYRVMSGTVMLNHDHNGAQYLRLTAYAFPPPPPPPPPPAPPPLPPQLSAKGTPCITAGDCASNMCSCSAAGRRRTSVAAHQSHALSRPSVEHNTPPRANSSLQAMKLYSRYRLVHGSARSTHAAQQGGRRLFGATTTACTCA